MARKFVDYSLVLIDRCLFEFMVHLIPQRAKLSFIKWTELFITLQVKFISSLSPASNVKIRSPKCVECESMKFLNLDINL